MMTLVVSKLAMLQTACWLITRVSALLLIATTIFRSRIIRRVRARLPAPRKKWEKRKLHGGRGVIGARSGVKSLKNL